MIDEVINRQSNLAGVFDQDVAPTCKPECDLQIAEPGPPLPQEQNWPLSKFENYQRAIWGGEGRELDRLRDLQHLYPPQLATENPRPRSLQSLPSALIGDPQSNVAWAATRRVQGVRNSTPGKAAISAMSAS